MYTSNSNSGWGPNLCTEIEENLNLVNKFQVILETEGWF